MAKRIGRIIVQYWRTITWVLIIFFLSTIQIPKVPRTPLFSIPHFDKLVHLFLYFILATIYLVDTYKKEKRLSTKQYFLIIVLSIMYGAAMEIVQKVLVQNRSGDFLDALANITGVFIAYMLFKFLFFYRTLLLRILFSN